ncbi:MAG TPA: hypothetical protein VFO52_15675 [Longimicrobiales bacterium]|nr:hypothetical protein [Longimicrobiales bacterium]
MPGNKGRSPQITQRCTAADDERAIINDRQGSCAICKKLDYVVADAKQPGLGVVAARCQDGSRDERFHE